MYTAQLGKELEKEQKDTNVIVSCYCPGWVKTRMGGENAERTPEEGAKTAVFLANLADGSQNGKFWKDEKVTEY